MSRASYVAAIAARVRIDRRQPLNVATRGASDDALSAVWWGALAWTI